VGGFFIDIYQFILKYWRNQGPEFREYAHLVIFIDH